LRWPPQPAPITRAHEGSIITMTDSTTADQPRDLVLVVPGTPLFYHQHCELRGIILEAWAISHDFPEWLIHTPRHCWIFESEFYKTA
jgi:hypothetical protein